MRKAKVGLATAFRKLDRGGRGVLTVDAMTSALGEIGYFSELAPRHGVNSREDVKCMLQSIAACGTMANGQTMTREKQGKCDYNAFMRAFGKGVFTLPTGRQPRLRQGLLPLMQLPQMRLRHPQRSNAPEQCPWRGREWNGGTSRSTRLDL